MSIDNLLKISVEEYSDMIDFAKLLVFKDQLKADEASSSRSENTAIDYITSHIKDNTSSTDSYLENTRKLYELEKEHGDLVEAELHEALPLFAEYNKYYRDLYVEKDVLIYKARTANDFEIVRSSQGKISDKYINLFITEHFRSLTYFKKVLYTEGFSGSEGYRNFVRFFTVFMTLERTLDKIKGPPALNIEMMDEYAMRNLMYSYGIDFLDDLNVSYRKLILRNLNFLLKYKGSDKVFTTIFNIFGFKNVEAFKYYIIKDYPYDEATNSYDYSKPDAKFLRIPYEVKNYEKYIQGLPKSKVASLKYDFSTITAGDPLWKTSKETVLKQNFNILNTKYFDINSALDIIKTSGTLTYFFNELASVRTDREGDERLEFYDANLSNENISVYDALLGINYLLLISFGLTGNIPKSENELERVYKFRQDIDTEQLSTIFYSTFSFDRYLTTKDIPTDITTGNLVLTMESSLKLMEDMEEVMINELDVDVYQALYKDYEYLFMSDLMTNHFDGFDTYIQYIASRNEDFAYFIEDIIKKSDESSDESKDTVLRNAISAIASSLESYVDSNYFNPNFLNIVYILEFVRRMIVTFKAYTIELRDIAVFYQVDNEFHKLKLLDKIDDFYAEFDHWEDLGLKDMIHYMNTNYEKDCLALDDFIKRVVKLFISEVNEDSFLWEERLEEVFTKIDIKKLLQLSDKISTTVSTIQLDGLSVKDTTAFEHLLLFDLIINLEDGFLVQLLYEFEDDLDIKDDFNLESIEELIDYILLREGTVFESFKILDKKEMLLKDSMDSFLPLVNCAESITKEDKIEATTVDFKLDGITMKDSFELEIV